MRPAGSHHAAAWRDEDGGRLRAERGFILTTGQSSQTRSARPDSGQSRASRGGAHHQMPMSVVDRRASPVEDKKLDATGTRRWKRKGGLMRKLFYCGPCGRASLWSRGHCASARQALHRLPFARNRPAGQRPSWTSSSSPCAVCKARACHATLEAREADLRPRRPR